MSRDSKYYTNFVNTNLKPNFISKVVEIEAKIEKHNKAILKLRSELPKAVKGSTIQCAKCNVESKIGETVYIYPHPYSNEPYSEGNYPYDKEGAFICNNCGITNRFFEKDNKDLIFKKYFFKNVINDYDF